MADMADMADMLDMLDMWSLVGPFKVRFTPPGKFPSAAVGLQAVVTRDSVDTGDCPGSPGTCTDGSVSITGPGGTCHHYNSRRYRADGTAG